MCGCGKKKQRKEVMSQRKKIRKELCYSSQHTEDGRVLDSISHTVSKLQVHISIVLAPQNVHRIQFIR